MSNAEVANIILNNIRDEDLKFTKATCYSQQWISVEDRLPEKIGYYLVVRNINKVTTRKFDEWITGSRKRFWHSGGEDESITHWMPLPEPPHG
jgi:hypothetical protein